jgi:hypothetical protein
MVTLVIVGEFIAPSAAHGQTSAPVTILVDQDLTMATGTSDVLALERGLAVLEDRLLPTHFSEATPLTHGFGIGYRVGKWLAVDLPQDSFLMVVAHEVFGHGARLREVGAPDVHYSFDAPLPYGDGDAVTIFNGTAAMTRADVLGIDSAGIEAQNVLADQIGEQAFRRRTWSYRDSWLYLQSRMAGLLYIRSVSPGSPPGHDVADFLHDFNSGCEPPVCTPLQASTLKRRALLMLGDPLLAFSAYGFAVAYLSHGETTSTVPGIQLPNGWRYLPAMGFAMTAYGTAWTTEHNLSVGDRLTRVSLRIGEAGATHTWSIGVRSMSFAGGGPISADLSAEVWRQPPLDAPPTSKTLSAGALAAATVRVALGHRTSSRLRLTGQAGYKSTGFVPAEPLRSGPLVRVGITIALDDTSPATP